MFFLIAMIANAYITASPSSIDFGDISVDRSIGRSQTVWVRNNSNQPVQVYRSDNCFGDFRVTGYCGYLSAYSSCNLRVEFVPRFEGFASCNINLSSNQGAGASVWVRGRGVADRSLEIEEMFVEP